MSIRRPSPRRRTVSFTVLASALVLALVGAFAPAQGATTPAAGTVTLGGVSVRLGAGTRQVVTVNHTHGHHATVAFWRYSAGKWLRRSTAYDGRIGYGGLVVGDQRKQGTGTTPLGTYRLLYTFGTHARSTHWRMAHRRIHRGDYWVEDNGSRYYNRYRNRAQGGFRWRLDPNAVNGSERLADFPQQYEYAVVTSFNYWQQVRYRGAGIFLHVNGSGATAGCVSAPRWFLKETFGRLDPALKPVIAIGR
jgi:L,D-peptidoglycan transpeptidase YkuD (ErfK/YbiS/YcfS/YnhG family)